MLKQPHLLIAGRTGSGKSVVINGLIFNALYRFPFDKKDGAQFILCDPKMGVELGGYRHLPHTLYFAKTVPEILKALEYAYSLMMQRFHYMERLRLREYDEGDIYVIIDEFADLMLQTNKKQRKIFYEIGALGRAAHVRLIIATQMPNRDIIDKQIIANMTAKCALQCESAIESRQVIGVPGAELLPRYGDCLYKTPENGLTHFTEVKMYSDAELSERVRWWTKQRLFGFMY